MKRIGTREAQERALKRTIENQKDNLSDSDDQLDEEILAGGGEQEDDQFINDGDLTKERIEIEEQEQEELRIHQLLKRAQKAKKEKSSNMFTRTSNPRLFSKKKIDKVEPEVEAAEREALAQLENETAVVGFTKEDELEHKYNVPAKLEVKKKQSGMPQRFKPALDIEGEIQVLPDDQLLGLLAECQEEEKEEAKKKEEEIKARMANYARNQRNATPDKLERTRPLSTTPVKQQSQTVQKTITTAAVTGLDAPAQAVEVFKNEDGTIPFYWYDAHEMPNDRKGEIFLFGKVLDRRTGQHVSATVVVKGLERVYYAVPRGSQKIREIEDSGEGEEPEIDGMKIYSEIEQIRRTRYPGIHEWKCKMVSRSYAFELPLPHARPIQCLKIKYDAKYPPLMDTQGKNFEYMFGVNGSLLQDFLLKRKIMGPCWLRVHNPVIKHVRSGGEGVSWSRFEMETASPRNIECTVEDKNKDAPSLNAISLAVKVSRTFEDIPAHKKGQKKQAHAMPKSKEQIAIISILQYQGLSVEHPTSSDKLALQSKNIREYSFVAKIEGSMLNFQAKMQNESARGKPGSQNQRNFFNSQKDMLTTFIARFQHLDPDILVAHNATSSVIELLVARMQQVGVAHFSRIGKLKQTRLRTLTSGQAVQAGMWISRQAMIGRLLVDTTLSAQELIRETNYTLTHLVKTQMNEERQSFDQDRLQKIFGSTPDQVMGVIEHTRKDSELVLRLMLRLNVIPLTKKLTNIAGNLWYRSLQNARAERNEFLLLHHFKARKFLLPDKKVHKKIFKEDQNEEEDNLLKPKRQKAAYSGGLVLEPDIGFYDRYILLLDFNSLYPSIIREFNICFTTIKRPPAQQFDGEVMQSSFGEKDTLLPDMDSSTSKSVLPSILQNLVTKRKTIKRQMKEKAAELSKKVKDPTTHPQYMQLDTAQKAYKLTANSIYGCLGFSYSRFYAKPLAALITRTGRDLLKQTVDLARHMEYPVIYGDTDSIMVDSRTREIKEAVQIASRLKSEVNDQFKKSKKHRGLLEIDIDGVFQSLLLLRKKKYAALMLMNPFEVAADSNVKPVLKRELKGLDAVRRDWSPLSSNVQKVILDMVLSGMERDDLVSKVYEYFPKLNGDLRSGTIPLKDFLITKGLSRMPHQYRDVKGQPHVAVALRLMEQKKLYDNYIPYAICKGSSKTLSERAYHPDEIMARDDLILDVEWYIMQQIMPPVSRILTPLQVISFKNKGIDMKQIASLMGVDARKFNQATEENEQQNNEDDFQIAKARGLNLQQRAKHLKIMTGFSFKVKCHHCDIIFEIEGPFRLHKRTQKYTNTIATQCPACDQPLQERYLHNRISYEINTLMSSFYNGEHRCPELTCKKTTSMFSLNEDRCLWKGCAGSMQAVTSDRKVDKCLQYLETIFNVKHLDKEKANLFDDTNKAMAEQLRNRVLSVKSLSVYSEVKLAEIFDFF